MTQFKDLLQSLVGLSAPQLRRLLTEHLTKQKLGLYWEASAIERDAAPNANIALLRLVKKRLAQPEPGRRAGHAQPDYRGRQLRQFAAA